MMKQTLLLAATAVGLSAGIAQAEFAVGGWVNLEYEDQYGDYRKTLRGDVLATYGTQGGLTFGVGLRGDLEDSGDTSGFERRRGGVYGLVSFGDGISSFGEVTVSYGDIWGAGNLFPEEYFGFDDTTSTDDDTLRVDLKFGNHQIAFSNDFNGVNADWEFGYRGRFGAYAVAVGYENDSEDLGILIGRKLNDQFAVHLAIVEDLDESEDAADHQGISLIYTPNDRFTLGLNAARYNEGFHSAGVLVSYTTDRVILKAEYVKFHDDDDDQFEFGVVIPFGRTQPAHDARFTFTDYTGFGLF